MKPFHRVEGPAIAMLAPNIDTDQILPKQFLRTITRKGLGRALFYNSRFDESGAPKADAILNRIPAAVLIGGENFGCGSSREHAAWALDDYGIRCVIAPSFADIFSVNCANNGVLLISLESHAVSMLAQEAGTTGRFCVDLERCVVETPRGWKVGFYLDPHLRNKLLRGLDEIGQTLSKLDSIHAFENRQRVRTPWLG